MMRERRKEIGHWSFGGPPVAERVQKLRRGPGDVSPGPRPRPRGCSERLERDQLLVFHHGAAWPEGGSGRCLRTRRKWRRSCVEGVGEDHRTLHASSTPWLRRPRAAQSRGGGLDCRTLSRG